MILLSSSIQWTVEETPRKGLGGSDPIRRKNSRGPGGIVIVHHDTHQRIDLTCGLAFKVLPSLTEKSRDRSWNVTLTVFHLRVMDEKVVVFVGFHEH